MEFKQIIDNFKATHVSAGKEMGFSLLPILMIELMKNGLNISHMSGQFYQELTSEIFNGDAKLQLYVVDYVALLAELLPLPAIPEVKELKSNPKQNHSAVIEDNIVKTEHLIYNIPKEDEEGDPYYIPPEERLTLNPNDIEPTQQDVEFSKSIGATRFLR